MDRKQVVLSAEETLRQRDFERKLADIHRQRSRAPLALVDTFGCQQNVADSQHIMGMLQAMGCEFTDEADRADIIVLNTCAIRDHAEKRVFGNLGALTHTKKKNPEQIICLCGCMAQRPEIAEKVRTSYRHVDLVFGPQAMWKFPELLYRVYTRRGRVFSVEEEHGTIAEGMPVVREGRTRAWVSIMYGCNNFCSYCIVPYVRGRERSRDMDKIVAEVKELAAQGYKEITLLGQNVNSYGKGLENPIDFADLLNLLCEVPGDYQIRFMTSHPKDASRKLIDTIAAQEHLCKHIHLPVQSGSDRLLKEMNRHYNVAQYMELINYAKEKIPGVTFSSDIIVGFPGETEEDFAATLDLIRKVGYMQLFTFIYSKRTGTPAAKLPDPTTHAEKAARMERLLKTQEEFAFAATAAMTGQTVRVLVEAAGRNAGTVNGRLDNNLVVEFAAPESLIGQWARVHVTGSRAALLVGELAE